MLCIELQASRWHGMAAVTAKGMDCPEATQSLKGHRNETDPLQQRGAISCLGGGRKKKHMEYAESQRLGGALGKASTETLILSWAGSA